MSVPETVYAFNGRLPRRIPIEPAVPSQSVRCQVVCLKLVRIDRECDEESERGLYPEAGSKQKETASNVIGCVFEKDQHDEFCKKRVVEFSCSEPHRQSIGIAIFKEIETVEIIKSNEITPCSVATDGF